MCVPDSEGWTNGGPTCTTWGGYTSLGLGGGSGTSVRGKAGIDGSGSLAGAGVDGGKASTLTKAGYVVVWLCIGSWGVDNVSAVRMCSKSGADRPLSMRDGGSRIPIPGGRDVENMSDVDMAS